MTPEDEAESVRIAVRALDHMRNHNPANIPTSLADIPRPLPPSSSHAPSTSLPLPLPTPTDPRLPSHTSPPTDVQRTPTDPPRVSTLPLLNHALRAYESGKASSRVINYGAQFMESGVLSLSQRLPDGAWRAIDAIDRRAGAAIDSRGGAGVDGRVGESSRTDEDMQLDAPGPSTRPPGPSTRPPGPSSRSVERSTRPRGYSMDEDAPQDPTRGRAASTSSTRASSSQSRQSRQSPSRSRLPDPTDDRHPDPGGQLTPASGGGRWAAVLSEAGGLGAALSEESMRRLKYCLEWLQYATAHIDAQIVVLRDFIASLQPLPPPSPNSPHPSSPSVSSPHPNSSSSPNSPYPSSSPHNPNNASSSHSTRRAENARLSPTALHTLRTAHADVTHTVRSVVSVVSRYAGSALPAPARERVRGLVLVLPGRWREGVSSASHGLGGGGGNLGNTSNLGSTGGGGSTGKGGKGGTHGKGTNGVAAAAGTGGAGVRRRHARGSRASSPLASHSLPHSREHSHSLPHSSSPHSASHEHDGEDDEYREAHDEEGPTMTAHAAALAAQRVLVLATESLDMMRGVTGVVGDSLDRADAWVSRLRVVGVQRQQSGDIPPSGYDGRSPSSYDARSQEWRAQGEWRTPPDAPSPASSAYGYGSVPGSPRFSVPGSPRLSTPAYSSAATASSSVYDTSSSSVYDTSSSASATAYSSAYGTSSSSATPGTTSVPQTPGPAPGFDFGEVPPVERLSLKESVGLSSKEVGLGFKEEIGAKVKDEVKDVKERREVREAMDVEMDE
ncbi:hypothetical protein PLICRDRAFT_42772 [Plicaturopsis crispa FD-325 SS-3]|nr:hypothetical protein PLICRDRAFT_42772 [Plicaturopsis crispa FD-325 SS-3]